MARAPGVVDGLPPEARKKHTVAWISVVVVLVVVVVIASITLIPISHAFSFTIPLLPEYPAEGEETLLLPSGAHLTGGWSSTNGVVVNLTIGPASNSGCPDLAWVYVGSGPSGSFSLDTTCSFLVFLVYAPDHTPTTVFINGTYSHPLV
jgi:hypothetical protein